MLLGFKTKNYKSFRSEMDFSMVPAPKQKGLDYSVQNVKIGSTKHKALCSAVIYGPNASGKTNIIGAADTLRSIVLRGNIRNSGDITSPNIASFQLELIPFCMATEPEPVEFAIDFIYQGLAFSYALKLRLGVFLERDCKRRILEESLSINGSLVFARSEAMVIGDLTFLREHLNEGVLSNMANAKEIAENGLDDEELFLTNGFKTIFSKKLIAILTEWFASRFMVIYRADSMQIMHRYIDPQENAVYIEKTINEAAKAFGITSNALGFLVNKEKNESALFSIFKGEKGNRLVKAESFESYGTIRFINEFPLVLMALLTGSTLIVDEFDASIHPMALMNIIMLFHNDDININHAQLIFNTHNPIFLNAKLYRRDEIKFVERDELTQQSTHYSLSDFKTYGEKGVRKGEDYMRNYFINRYGAIKDVDFSQIIEALIKPEGEQSHD